MSDAAVRAIERDACEPTIGVLARLGCALGMRLDVRLYPGTGPLIRDHIQAAMITALLAMLHERWRPRPEVSVHRPVRGVIDLVLDDDIGAVIVACEAQSELRRLEQQIRWSHAKADALGISRAGEGSDARGPRVGRLLLLRSTARTRAIVGQYADVVAAAYPARCVDAYAALTGESTWPGEALLWCRVEDGVTTVLERPPRGISVGR